METIKAANKVIRDGVALLPDEAKGDFKAMRSDIFINEAISNAMGATNENEEKIALLKAYAIQEANRVASTVWRLVPPVPEEFEKEFRALPSMKEVADAYNVFTDDRKARMDKVMAAHKVIADEEGEAGNNVHPAPVADLLPQSGKILGNGVDKTYAGGQAGKGKDGCQ